MKPTPRLAHLMCRATGDPLKTIELKGNQIVRVRWIDSFVSPGWNHALAREAPEARAIFTIGYVENNTQDVLEIAPTKGVDGQILSPVSIPWGCVQSVEVLKGIGRSPKDNPKTASWVRYTD